MRGSTSALNAISACRQKTVACGIGIFRLSPQDRILASITNWKRHGYPPNTNRTLAYPPVVGFPTNRLVRAMLLEHYCEVCQQIHAATGWFVLHETGPQSRLYVCIEGHLKFDGPETMWRAGETVPRCGKCAQPMVQIAREVTRQEPISHADWLCEPCGTTITLPLRLP